MNVMGLCFILGVVVVFAIVIALIFVAHSKEIEDVYADAYKLGYEIGKKEGERNGCKKVS